MSSYTNPILEQHADPWMLKHTDGNYYFTASVPEYDRIELRKSKTIQGIGSAEAITIWRKHITGEMSAHIWAPEIHHIDGVWYIYFAAGKAELIWEIRIWVLSNDSVDPMQGEWIERGQLKTNWESFALDATTFEHRGDRYLCWAQNDPKIGPGTSLYLAKMSDPLHITGRQIRISQPTLDWETIGHRVNEGPAVLKRNGSVFIVYSASATDHNYCIGLLSADENSELLDAASWKKSPAPILKTCEASKQFGPGHNSFTIAEDGKTDVMIYHARPYRDVTPDALNDPNRHTFARTIGWNRDGAPCLNHPVPASANPENA